MSSPESTFADRSMKVVAARPDARAAVSCQVERPLRDGLGSAPVRRGATRHARACEPGLAAAVTPALADSHEADGGLPDAAQPRPAHRLGMSLAVGWGHRDDSVGLGLLSRDIRPLKQG